MREKSKGSEPIVQRDDDGALLGQSSTVVTLFAAEAGEESAAVDPDQYGGRGTRDTGRRKRERARPDVEVEAVFGDTGFEWIDVGVRLVLYAVSSEMLRISDSTPSLWRLRRFPTELAHRWCGVWNSAEDHHAGSVESFERTGVDRHPRWGNIARGDET